MATVKGVWMFNSTLTRPAMNFFPEVSFTSNNGSFTGMGVRQETKYYLLSYDITPIYGSTAWENEAYRVVDFGKTVQTVPDDFYAWFTDNAMTEEDIEEIRYSIYGSTLTAIADQVRRISGVEGGLTPEQMESNLMNVTVGAELPSAETASFGVDSGENTNEYGITSLTGMRMTGSRGTGTSGIEFVANEAIVILGLRFYGHGNNRYGILKLWDKDKQLLRESGKLTSSSAWIEYMFEEPVYIAIGEHFTVAVNRTHNQEDTYTQRENVVFNSKLSYQCSRTGAMDVFPEYTTTSELYGIPDIIMGEPPAPLPDDYQITRTTMDDIAEEVQRISGTTDKMTTTQIITNLSEIEVLEDYEEVAF